MEKDSHLIPGNAVEIVGKVQGDLSVRVLMATDFGANLGELLFVWAVVAVFWGWGLLGFWGGRGRGRRWCLGGREVRWRVMDD